MFRQISRYFFWHIHNQLTFFRCCSLCKNVYFHYDRFLTALTVLVVTFSVASGLQTSFISLNGDQKCATVMTSRPGECLDRGQPFMLWQKSPTNRSNKWEKSSAIRKAWRWKWRDVLDSTGRKSGILFPFSALWRERVASTQRHRKLKTRQTSGAGRDAWRCFTSWYLMLKWRMEDWCSSRCDPTEAIYSRGRHLLWIWNSNERWKNI